jgi:hypothetical protein
MWKVFNFSGLIFGLLPHPAESLLKVGIPAQIVICNSRIEPALGYHLMRPYFGNVLNLGLYPTGYQHLFF